MREARKRQQTTLYLISIAKEADDALICAQGASEKGAIVLMCIVANANELILHERAVLCDKLKPAQLFISIVADKLKNQVNRWTPLGDVVPRPRVKRLKTKV
jgi:hypothetical protein